MTRSGILLVRTAGRHVGIRLEDVIEVTELGAVSRVPSALPAVRGVTVARGRLVTLLHLGALLAQEACPDGGVSATVVLASAAGTTIALEVEEADTVSGVTILAPPEGSEFAGLALGAIRRGKEWIPILNLEALVAQWRAREAGV
ncbi:MAG: chemotaxis protein CheW [Gemmatimonadales bacterium]